MPDFEIKIVTPADLAGAKTSLAILQGQIKASQVMGKNFDEAQAKAEKLGQAIMQAELAEITGGSKAAEAITATGKAAEKAGEEGFKVLGRGAHGAHAILDSLNQAFPGLQMLSRFLMTGFTAAIGAAVLAFTYINSKVEEFNKLVDDLAGSDNAAGGWAKKLAENMRESHVAADVLADDIQRILDAQETLAQTTDQLIARQKQQQEAANTVADAQKELEEARLELAEKLGQITPDQAIKIKLEIDEEDFRRKQEAKIAGIKAELQARQQEQTGLGDLDQDQSAVEDARQAANAANAAKTKNDTLLENARENLKAAQEDQKKADERLTQTEYGKWDPRRVSDEIERKRAEKASTVDETKIGQYTHEVSQYEKKETGLDTAAEKTKKDLEEASDRWKEDAKTLHDLNQTISNLTASLAGAQAESATLINLHNQAAEARAKGQSFDELNGARQAVRSGKATPTQQDEVSDEVSQENWSQAASGTVDLRDLRNQVADARGAAGQGSRNDEALRAYHNEVMGLIQDVHMNAADRATLESLRREIEDLRGQISVDRNNR